MSRPCDYTPVTGTRKMVLLAVYIALSTIIQYFEQVLMPVALPFRPGLANIFTLVVIARFGISDALLVSITRSILASVIAGKLLTVPFYLGLSGGIISALVMGLLYKRFEELSEVGVSVLGACAHNLTQLLVVYLFFIPNTGILVLVPWMGVMSLVTGVVVGYAARVFLTTSFGQKVAFSEENTG